MSFFLKKKVARKFNCNCRPLRAHMHIRCLFHLLCLAILFIHFHSFTSHLLFPLLPHYRFLHHNHHLHTYLLSFLSCFSSPDSVPLFCFWIIRLLTLRLTGPALSRLLLDLLFSHLFTFALPSFHLLSTFFCTLNIERCYHRRSDIHFFGRASTWPLATSLALSRPQNRTFISTDDCFTKSIHRCAHHEYISKLVNFV